MQKNVVESAQTLTDELLKLVGVNATAQVSSEGKGEEQVLNVKIDAKEESGLLIGAHGATLEAIQSFLSIALNNETGRGSRGIRVFVDIADWNQKQKDKLEELATQTAERAKTKREPQYLYNLNASQRRIVHLTLSKDPEIETASEGEGEERYLIVRVKGK